MGMAIEEKITQLEELLDKVNFRNHGTGTVWPAIIEKNHHNPEEPYTYTYPVAFLRSLRQLSDNSLRFILSRDNKVERLTLVKMAIDKHMSGKIDIFTFHFCMFLIYGDFIQDYRTKGDFVEKAIGKKRAQFFNILPKVKYLSTDDFITAVWFYQIEGRHSSEFRQAPYTKNIRLLFSQEQFSNWAGRDYYDANWVEPIPGALDLKCRTWTEEKDPMAQESSLPEGWVEGNITLGHEGPGNYRHFVQGVPVHAGSAIQVKFGTGWIEGRYEWTFNPKNNISIHRGEDVIYICENHRVRVRE